MEASLRGGVKWRLGGQDKALNLTVGHWKKREAVSLSGWAVLPLSHPYYGSEIAISCRA
ncbi:hypothetical protein GCM10010840_02130 [Deinococcus aerolatus]|uniref:Uncharacterized protein n=1 Tax=Deinococcus aerolatus TaxID=522487 RepID=A0ABQ2FZN3_9DEIO|nr:hypothetical protein GCM10010840_02130 [Deinococcus aerolatus]